MKNTSFAALFVLLAVMATMNSGCKSASAQPDPAVAGAPPAAKIQDMVDLTLFNVERPEQFPFVAAVAHPTTAELAVNGTVMPDVSRNVPVVSLASGRVTEIHTRLGDPVSKGELLMVVRSDDVSGGYANYKMAVADEILARAQLDRGKDLYDHGAIALNDLQIAQDTEDKAKVTVDTAAEHLRLLGNDPEKPQAMVNIYAPTAGTITDQEVTVGSLLQAYNTPYPFTISDLTKIWVVCDVYENDLAAVKIGDSADIKLNAFPNRVFKGKVSNVLPILDPTIRTGKVRIEVENPGNLKLGMFATATFHGQTTEMHTVVPSSAILRMHDRDFVFVPAPGNKFRRVEIHAGDVLQDNPSQQEIISGIMPGDRVVTNALVLDHVISQ